MVFARSAINLARPAGSLFTQRVASRTATSQIGGVRTLTASSSRQGKVLLCLYDVSIFPIDQSLLSLEQPPDNTSSPQGKEHAKQEPRLLGTTENELGIRKWLEDQGHTLVTTSDKEGESSVFEKEMVDAEVIITTP